MSDNRFNISVQIFSETFWDTSCRQTRGQARRFTADSRQATLTWEQFWRRVEALVNLTGNGILRLEMPSAGGILRNLPIETYNEF